MTPEELARQDIDRQLAQCGWTVQNRNEMNISAAEGAAVREFPMLTGEADYLLYAAGKAIGVVEAKPKGHPLKVAAVLLTACGYALAACRRSLLGPVLNIKRLGARARDPGIASPSADRWPPAPALSGRTLRPRDVPARDTRNTAWHHVAWR